VKSSRTQRFLKHVSTLKAVEVTEQWNSHVAKVGGKVFALIGQESEDIVFKVTEMSFDMLTELEGVRQAPYFAKRAWVRVSPEADLSAKDIEAYVAASYEMIASKLTRKARAELGLD
jgi:predicted DNA-binding protein (MmcQ/YjbR family)